MKYTYPSSILSLLELIIVPFIIMSLVCMPLLFLNVDDGMLGIAMISIYGFIMFIYIWFKNKRRVNFNFILKLPDLVFVCLSVLFFLFFMLGIIVPFKSILNIGFEEGGSTVEIFSAFAFGAILIGPIVEEFLFRGIILTTLLHKYGSKWALPISSVLFALVHIHPAQIVIAFILGLILGYLFIKTKSLTFVILLHSVSNLSNLLIGEYLMISSFSSVGNGYMIYGEWTFYIIGIAILFTGFLAVRLYKIVLSTS